MLRIVDKEMTRREFRRLGLQHLARFRLGRKSTPRQSVAAVQRRDSVLEELRASLQIVVGEINELEPQLQAKIKERDSLLRKIRKHNKLNGR